MSRAKEGKMIMGNEESNNEKLLLSVYNDLASPGLKQIGKSVEDILKFVALPFRFLGLTSEQLETRYSKFIEGAINRVKPEKLVIPQSNIVAPLLDYVKFTFASDEGNILLQEMFSKLLSSSINIDTSHLIQKSFIENMRFLSKNEATLLKWLYDAIFAEKFNNLISPVRLSGFAFISSYYFLQSNISEYNLKTIEISAATPGNPFYKNLPISESLELLSSLGLIKIDKESYAGCHLFKDLCQLGDEGLLNFDIPPIFCEAMRTVKLNDNSIALKKRKYDNDLLQLLLKSEIPQLYEGLSSNLSVSVEQLMDMSCSRFCVRFTDYGRLFVYCCISPN